MTESTEVVGDPDVDGLQAIKDRARQARQEYERQQGLYRDFADDIKRLMRACLDNKGVHFHEISAREKDAESFERKAAKTSDDDRTVAKYTDPIDEISDKAAVRVTTYFLHAVDEVCEIINDEFQVIERLDKISSEPDRLGYQSIHYLVQHLATRTGLAEYRKFDGLTAEIQVRTILQHAWAEIEHDIQYKAVAAVPERVRRRFASLAGLIEIADREFQSIADENSAIRVQARIDIGSGKLDRVELTRDSLKEYLDQSYGPDGRMREWSYDYAVRTLLAMGFTNLAEVDECIRGYDDGEISRLLAGSRQGQLTRFEYVLLASMGDGFVIAHPFTQKLNWFAETSLKRLLQLREAGISLGDYRPPGYSGGRLTEDDLAKLKNEAEAVFKAGSAESSGIVIGPEL